MEDNIYLDPISSKINPIEYNAAVFSTRAQDCLWQHHNIEQIKQLTYRTHSITCSVTYLYGHIWRTVLMILWLNHKTTCGTHMKAQIQSKADMAFSANGLLLWGSTSIYLYHSEAARGNLNYAKHLSIKITNVADTLFSLSQKVLK